MSKASDTRNRLRRQLKPLGADDISIYYDGSSGRGLVRFAYQGQSVRLDAREAEKRLQSVSGEGPQAALAALSAEA